MARQVRAWLGVAWQGRHGKAMRGELRRGMAGKKSMEANNMVYSWKSNARIQARADVAASVFDELERTGGLTPKRLVESSKPKDAPLHGEFEWNDTIAAANFRESQARHLIRCLVVTEDAQKDAEPVRAYFSVTEPTEYTHITRILPNIELKERMLEQAMNELSAFQRKYSRLKELEPIFGEIAKLNRREATGSDAIRNRHTAV